MIRGIQSVAQNSCKRCFILRRDGCRIETIQMVASRGYMSSLNTSSSSSSTIGISHPSIFQDRKLQQQQIRWFSDEKKEEEEAGEETPDKDDVEGTDTPNKEDELSSEIKSLKDQLLRSLAEQENTRQIAKKDIESARNFAIKSFAKSLLEVSDNLQRALESVDQEELGKNPSLQSLHEGIQMTSAGLDKAFASNGVVKYCETPGDLFDPETMNALMEYPDPSKEPGTVGQVIKTGFTLNKRVLRPAEVGVIKKP